jgi:hypothetical protein
MKKIILSYGLIAGFIVTAFMVYATYAMNQNPDFKPSEVMGYAGMLIAFTFVFLGIRNFRNNQNHGSITFGQAFKIGALITLIASTCYVLVWLVEYYCFFPDFMEKYAAMALKHAQESGLSGAELQAKTKEMDRYREWYKNPIFVILLTYMEILPLGLVIALISALILKKKPVTA